MRPNTLAREFGKELFIHALNLARQRGYKSLQFEAAPNALGFYERMGMMKIGRRKTFQSGRLDACPSDHGD
ncbi:MAG: GNAT family N-acetyltransferase [Anaerolineales bacterium]|nr:GNAT family N-acetyltransferase [Anaerolineales bacterium]